VRLTTIRWWKEAAGSLCVEQLSRTDGKKQKRREDIGAGMFGVPIKFHVTETDRWGSPNIL
jgi:hypothetical protein